MLCPICKETQLVMTERKNIEIDYCPSCRGVWLDRGELDKVIEKSMEELAKNTSYDSSVKEPDHRKYTDHSPHNRDYNRQHSHHHKKKSFWMELFD